MISRSSIDHYLTMSVIINMILLCICLGLTILSPLAWLGVLLFGYLTFRVMIFTIAYEDETKGLQVYIVDERPYMVAVRCRRVPAGPDNMYSPYPDLEPDKPYVAAIFYIEKSATAPFVERENRKEAVGMAESLCKLLNQSS